MGMSCFLVQKWMRIIKVSCFSVHFCPQLSLIPCFVCICLHILLCSFAGFSEYEVTFACIFTGFAESRPWECRVFSFKIARTSQKSRVFPFTFAPDCPQSHVLRVFLNVFVHLCGILCWCAAVCGREFLSRVDILMQFLRCFLRAVYGNVVFFR